MLTCVIIDDEPLAREVVEGHLKRLDFIGPVHSFGNSRDAQSFLQAHDADVLFLDIEMPETTGIEFLKSLEQPPLTIFTTAYRDYAFEGFELGVIDFLLKPISFSRFTQAIEKVRDFLALKEQNTNIEDTAVDEMQKSVFVKSGVQRIKLNFDDVTHIQGLKDYAIIYTFTEKIVMKGSIKAMLDIFPKTGFVRVHKSFIVSFAKITKIDRNRIVLNGHQIPIGRNYKEEIETRFFL
ncbi:LytR/AlgR family response regulator transcription factor [Dyadobacter pollutisoli]|jgi:DNA-binding LytR/AlgR family response regulator|uniref:LytTR family DNA-binding domain-containing protein n=1 Tax=Dyadobacter pollutisoli TaxID=2910158 RepID=A0A9E8NFP3_9BACT|nr:LytTR family DNA-binding domain-containing protein [Dyadobacter pollutisoli]WAC14107.1 LytTR family DNA-binding domain-containing protein [Dyadobacter pollutisoli]